jgi:hypothetical protein
MSVTRFLACCHEGPLLFVNSDAFVNIVHLHTHMPLACQWND